MGIDTMKPNSLTAFFFLYTPSSPKRAFFVEWALQNTEKLAQNIIHVNIKLINLLFLNAFERDVKKLTNL